MLHSEIGFAELEVNWANRIPQEIVRRWMSRGRWPFGFCDTFKATYWEESIFLSITLSSITASCKYGNLSKVKIPVANALIMFSVGGVNPSKMANKGVSSFPDYRPCYKTSWNKIFHNHICQLHGGTKCSWTAAL